MLVSVASCWHRVLPEFCGCVAAEPPDLLSVKSDAVGWLCCVSLPHFSDHVRSHFWIHLPFLFWVQPSFHALVLFFGICVHA